MEPNEKFEEIEINQENGKKNSSRYRIFSTLLWCVLAFALGATLSLKLSGVSQKELQLNALIRHMYDGEVNEKNFEDYKLSGMVSGLKDKNSFYVTTEEMNYFNEAVTGKFGGIGVQIINDEGKVVVESVLKGTPAEKQGLIAGDVIISVDGKNVSEIPYNQITDYVRGDVGTEVVLGILRNGETIDVTIVREMIMADSVEAEVLDGGIGYVKISSFDDDTDEELEKTLTELEGEIGSLIIDLRDNPGGLLKVCTNVADLFLEKNKIIVKACYKNNENIIKTNGDAKFEMPMVVLIDGGSASSSEIFSSCMQDHKRATVVGVKSYGKGSIQRTHEFGDGSGVNLTVGHFCSPNGTKIDGVGVTPDVVVELSGETDTQLEKAIEILNTK